MSHNSNLSKAGLPSVETLTRRILRTFDRATASDIEAGSRWYPEMGTHCHTLGHIYGVRSELVAAVVSHLSPRLQWKRNVTAAVELLADPETRPNGIMTGNYSRARSALLDDWDNPVDSFNGAKTRCFYLNILGDTEAVTVDVWACNVVGVDPETELGRKGIYDAVEHAHRLAARRRGVEPSTMQAVTWVVARGRAS